MRNALSNSADYFKNNQVNDNISLNNSDVNNQKHNSRRSSLNTFTNYSQNNLLGNKQKKDVNSEMYEFVGFVQWFCASQLKAVTGAYRLNGRSSYSLVTGIDISFALSYYSGEAQFHPEYFLTDYCLGEVPTKENPLGKIFHSYPYAFPNAISLFKDRVAYFSSIFPLIRLENTLNYFRQWVVPKETSEIAVSGHYIPQTPITDRVLETWGLWNYERYTLPYICEKV